MVGADLVGDAIVSYVLSLQTDGLVQGRRVAQAYLFRSKLELIVGVWNMTMGGWKAVAWADVAFCGLAAAVYGALQRVLGSKVDG